MSGTTTFLARLRWTFRWWLARWRARWRFRDDASTIAARLADGRALPGPLDSNARPLPAPEPRALPDTDFHSVPEATRAVTGREAPTFRLASIRMLPPPPLELGIVRLSAWPLDVAKPPPAPPVEHRPGARALSLARSAPVRHVTASFVPARFGLDPASVSTRVERAPAPLPRGPLRPSLRINLSPDVAARLKPPDPGVVRPEHFGLDAALQLPTEANALPARLPLPLSPARANFRAKWIDPVHPHERAGLVVPESFGERVRTKVAPLFASKAVGASGQWREKAIDPAVGEALEQVHEQFLLRRDVPKMDEPYDDLVSKVQNTSRLGAPIKAFTGLTFVDLQPTPVKALQMKLERPPPDMAPLVEPTMLALAELVRTVRDHPDAPPPPLPDVANT